MYVQYIAREIDSFTLLLPYEALFQKGQSDPAVVYTSIPIKKKIRLFGLIINNRHATY